jgi:hypothetical protein
MLKTGSAVKIKPAGHDTWRFNFFLDLLFEDEAHLIAWANGARGHPVASRAILGIE